jgi:hypothetical protein
MQINAVKKINWNDILESYKVTCVDGTVCQVPIKAGNTDYQAVLKWVADGNTIDEAD